MTRQIAEDGDEAPSVVARSVARRSSFDRNIRKHCTESSINQSCERSPIAHAVSPHARPKIIERHEVRRVHQGRCQSLREANQGATNIVPSRFPCMQSASPLRKRGSITSGAAKLRHLRKMLPPEKSSTSSLCLIATARRLITLTRARFKPSYTPYIRFNGRCLLGYEWVNVCSFDSFRAAQRRREEWALRRNEEKRKCGITYEAIAAGKTAVTRLKERAATVSCGTFKIGNIQKGLLLARGASNAVGKSTSFTVSDDTMERAPSHRSSLA